MKASELQAAVGFGTVKPNGKYRGTLLDKLPEYNGYIVIRLSQRFAYEPGEDLYEFCRKHKLELLESFLKELGHVPAKKVIGEKLSSKLKELEDKAKRSERPPQRSMSTYWKLDLRSRRDSLDEILKRLLQIPGVEYAYKEHTPSPPAINPVDDVYATDQDYLDAAPAGIDARWAWTQPDCEGAGVGMVDCEWGWNVTHEDLSASAPTLIHNGNSYGTMGNFDDSWSNHGTAVLGEVVGTDNNLGVVGIAPSVDYVKMSSFYDAATDSHADSSEAMVAAITAMNPGDVMLLEIQKDYKPTEIDDTDFDAIRLAVANGIIVVEAAGNGNTDLDAWSDAAGKFRLNRSHPDFQDSGSIMVGASVSAVVGGAHERWWASNYGTRIDCYAYGADVVTTGYGDLAGTIDNDEYTESFGGTSGASPMIVGCALIIQGKYKALNPGTILSPLQMRVLLSNPATGTPQGPNVAGHISVMPNLRAILEDTLGLVPDIYLRDDIGDNGTIPSAGAISASPDIIVLPSAVADPTASFGEGSGNENSNILGYNVEKGQDNFIYVRMKNRGTSTATGVAATVYWSEVATLITPDMWNLVGTSAPINVPDGDTLVVTDPIVWAKAGIPATGHYCFVGLLDSAQDPAPPIPPVAGFDWNNFYNFIRNNNNVTWRNYNVVDVLPDAPDAPFAFPFKITNAPDKKRKFDFQIFRQLPAGVDLWLEIPTKFRGLLKGIEFLEGKENKKNGAIHLKLPRLRSIQFNSIILNAKARIPCRFYVKSSKALMKGVHQFGIRQLYNGYEVGRITWALKPKSDRKKTDLKS